MTKGDDLRIFNTHIDSLVVVESHMGGDPEKATNESLGLIGGGSVGLHGDREPEKATNKSLGLVGGDSGLHDSIS